MIIIINSCKKPVQCLYLHILCKFLVEIGLDQEKSLPRFLIITLHAYFCPALAH